MVIMYKMQFAVVASMVMVGEVWREQVDEQQRGKVLRQMICWARPFIIYNWRVFYALHVWERFI